MNKKILFIVFIILLVLAVTGLEREEYVLLEISYSNGEFTLINKTLETGNSPTLNHDTGKSYNLNLVSDTGDILYSLKFDPTLLYSDALIGEDMHGNAEILSEAEFFLAVPGIKGADKVEILKDNIKVFEEEVYNVGASSCRIK